MYAPRGAKLHLALLLLLLMLLMPDDCHPQVWFVLHKKQIKIGHIQVYFLSLAFFFAKV